jgi:hypothetical protein
MGPHVSDPGLTHIIDTSATEIHRPASQSAQSATFSDYYGCNCGKWLLAMSPSGFIRYISRAYPGRILDTKICSCGFYQHLEDLKAGGVSSAVQADKGFYCFFEMAAHNASLVVPSPATAQNQMSETQVEHTARIANERIFVEHAVKAVKRLKWLRRRVPLIQVDLIDPPRCWPTSLTSLLSKRKFERYIQLILRLPVSVRPKPALQTPSLSMWSTCTCLVSDWTLVRVCLSVNDLNNKLSAVSFPRTQ